MGVVAKFHVNSVELLEHGGQKINASPVYPQASDDVTSKEDGAFWEATPQGALWMLVNNPDAAEQFQPGDDFYLTFEKVQKPDAS